MSGLEIYTGRDGKQWAVGPQNERQLLTEFCLSLRCPETGVRVGHQILFADGSSSNLNASGGSYPPTPNQHENPGRCEKLIFSYWNERFNRSSKAFADLQYVLKLHEEQGGGPTRDDIDELKRLKKITESTAVQLKEAEINWRKTQPRFHHEFIEKTEEVKKALAASAEHNHKMRQEAASIELNV